MKWLVKVFFYCWLIFFVPAKNIFANDRWFEVNPNPAVIWQENDESITGLMEQPIGNNFLVTNNDFFPTTDNFVWQFVFTPQQGNDHNFVWGFIDESNYYQLHFAAGSIWVNRFIAGQEMLAKGINFAWRQQQAYQLKIVRENGLLSIFLDGYEIFHFADWTYDPLTSVGSWGFKLSAGSVYPVETIIKELKFFDHNFFVLPVTQVFQTDSLWSASIYDHAESWSSQPTIGHWGCALTSAVMILNFHGFNYLPNGQVLDPESLNQWLKTQADGYIADGLVNWWAITRLTKQLADQDLALPKLEFSVVTEHWQTTAELLIRSRVPVIAQVPGHFVVFYGFDQDNHDFLVNDPLVGQRKTVDYQQINSLRVFQPSFTDLSYLIVAHHPLTEVNITANNGEKIETRQLVEQLTTDQSEVYFTLVPKPIEQDYLIEFSNLTPDFSPTIYAYDETAKVSLLNIEKNIFDQQKIKLSFKKNQPVTFQYLFSWHEFLKLVDDFVKQQLISEKMKTRVEERVQLINQATTHQDKFRQELYLKNLLAFYQNFFDQAAITQLQTMFFELTSLGE